MFPMIFLNTYIQTNHENSKYPKKDYFKCRACGKEFNNRKLLDIHIVVKH